MLDTIVSIILFVVAFGALICIHEAGHLSMAKLFKVYCKEYSIGFGPKIFSRKKEGKETRFSIRAIPLGGYVAMYGEGAEEDPEFKDIPKERSLEGIKKWKKAIILSAGVILNAVLAFILIFISDVAFPNRMYTSKAHVTENSLVAKAGIKDNDRLNFIYPSSYEEVDKEGHKTYYAFSYEYTDKEKVMHAGSFYVVDSDVTLSNPNKDYSADHFVAGYIFSGNKNEPVFSDGLLLFKGIAKDDLNTKLKYDTDLKKDFIKWSKEAGSPEYYPNFEESFSPLNKTKFTLDLTFTRGMKILPFSREISVKVENKTVSYTDIGLAFQIDSVYAPFGERLKNTFVDYGRAAGAVFKGLGVLFTGGIRNMSGIVGIFSMSSTLYTSYTFATYLYFWGLISVNLAIFNLLPFPGLDGWQLLVTAIEGISHKKLPNKFKTIMSIIGLALLFALMIAIVVLDILRIVGV